MCDYRIFWANHIVLEIEWCKFGCDELFACSPGSYFYIYFSRRSTTGEQTPNNPVVCALIFRTSRASITLYKIGRTYLYLGIRKLFFPKQTADVWNAISICLLFSTIPKDMNGVRISRGFAETFSCNSVPCVYHLFHELFIWPVVCFCCDYIPYGFGDIFAYNQYCLMVFVQLLDWPCVSELVLKDIGKDSRSHNTLKLTKNTHLENSYLYCMAAICI